MRNLVEQLTPDSLASHHLPADDWVLARPALNKVARPRRQMPSASRDWAHIDGEWYAVIAGWPSDSPSILTVMRNIKVHSDSARNSAKMRKLHLKHGTARVSSFVSDLPRSESLPAQPFEGDLDSGSGIYLQGVARLTTDTPPEIRYSMLIWDEGVLRLRFEGVQIGGFSSKQGVMGVSWSLGALISGRVRDCSMRGRWCQARRVPCLVLQTLQVIDVYSCCPQDEQTTQQTRWK